MKKHDEVVLRREHVFQSMSKGESQASIARRLNLDPSVIQRDLVYISNQARANVQNYLDIRLPIEYEKCLAGMDSILEEAWAISERSSGLSNVRDKIQALQLAKECYEMRLNLLTNVNVVRDSLKFIDDYKNKKNNKNGMVAAEDIDKDKVIPISGNAVPIDEDYNNAENNNQTTNMVF